MKIFRYNSNTIRKLKIRVGLTKQQVGLPSTAFNFVKTKSGAGFTLIETLIYIVLIGITITSFVAFSLFIIDSRNKNYAVQEVQANSRIALNLITQKILASNGINSAASIFDTDPGVLSLSMVDTNKNPTLISLNADNGQLQIKEGTGDYLTITSDELRVINLIFTDLTGTSDKANIGIELSIEFNNPGTDVSFDFNQNLETAVTLRQ